MDLEPSTGEHAVSWDLASRKRNNRMQSVLSLTGHGTNGEDGLDRGVHLRWQFVSDVGFPLGGFRLYRRLSKPTVPIEPPRSIPAGAARLKLSQELWLVGLEGGTFRGISVPGVGIPGEDSPSPPPVRPGRISPRPLPRGPLPPIRVVVPQLPGTAQLVFRKNPVGPCDLHLWSPSQATVKIQAFFKGGEVFATVETLGAGRHALVPVLAPRITSIRIQAPDVGLVRVCTRPEDRCEHDAGWEFLRPLCLPVYYPGNPCGTPPSPKGDFDEAVCRLVDGSKACANVVPDGFADIIPALRALVDSRDPRPQAERTTSGHPETVPDYCPPPEEPAPRIGMSIVDSLLLAALDPDIARVLALSFVDHPPDTQPYDYKVVGDWLPGSLWRLPSAFDFDRRPVGHRLKNNVLRLSDMLVLCDVRPVVAQAPPNPFGRSNALWCTRRDADDWRLPIELEQFKLTAGGTCRLRIRFLKDVREVQVWLRATRSVRMIGVDAQGKEIPPLPPLSQQSADRVLAIQAEDTSEPIAYVEFEGEDFLIYRIAWGPDRIPHGIHCAYAHGLRADKPTPPPRPGPVTAFPLPGLVQKQADCQPSLTGATKDSRLSIGVSWDVPRDGVALQTGAPICYEVWRRGRTEPETASLQLTNEPLFPTRNAAARPYRAPGSWPEKQPLLVDDTPAPNTEYQYRVRGLDLFGRFTEYGDWSPPVEAELPLPPPPSNLRAAFLDSDDPWLSAADRQALTAAEVTEAIRLKWSFPPHALRQYPDIRGFRLYYRPGLPNVLEAEILDKWPDNPTGALELSLRILRTTAIGAQELVGRRVMQTRIGLFILAHGAGVASNNYVEIKARLRRPINGSRTRLERGPATIPLDAAVPIEVLDVTEDGDFVIVSVQTECVATDPAGGWQGATISLLGEDVLIETAVNAGAATDSDGYCRRSFRTKAPAAIREAITHANLPVFTTLRMPAVADQVNLTTTLAWPPPPLTDIPFDAATEFDCLIREAAASEQPGLHHSSPGHYELVLDQFLEKLQVGANRAAGERLRAHGAFAITSLSPSLRRPESSLSTMALVTRVHHGPLGTDAQLNTLSQIQAVNARPRLFATAPNFAGKSSFAFTWPSEEGWTYQVFRALDETLFAVDAEVRRATPVVGTDGRFPTPAEIAAFMASFPPALHTDIRSIIIDPQELSRSQIEADQLKVDTLLQALASLPKNADAFTQLPQDAILLDPLSVPNHVTCIDRSIDGRSSARYLYRIRATDSLGQTSTLGSSTPPVHTVHRLATPVINRVTSRERRILLSWVCSSATSLLEYRVFRTDSKDAAKDLRRMTQIAVVAADPAPASRPATVEWPDEPVLGLIDFYYRIVAVDRPDPVDPQRGGGNVSEPSAIVQGRARQPRPSRPVMVAATWDGARTSVQVTWQLDDPLLVPRLERSLGVGDAWRVAADWLLAGTTTARDLPPDAGVSYEYRVRVRNHIGQQAISDPVATT